MFTVRLRNTSLICEVKLCNASSNHPQQSKLVTEKKEKSFWMQVLYTLCNLRVRNKHICRISSKRYRMSSSSSQDLRRTLKSSPEDLQSHPL